jgi:hypothetical protein
MSYLLHKAATTSVRPAFADFSLKYAVSGPGKVAHIFTVIGASIPFYLFSSAYRGTKDSRTWAKRAQITSASFASQI